MAAQSERRFIARGVAHLDLAYEGPAVQVSFVLVPNFTMLAFTSAVEPFRVANQLAGKSLFEWSVWSVEGENVTASNGMQMVVDGPLPAEAPPGYVMICSGVEPELNLSRKLSDWVRVQWRRGRTVGGLCTGAYTLARAGILKDRQFTLHWENIPGFRESWPGLEPARRIWCLDNRVITCAGGVASAELVLKLIQDHYGAELAQAVMNMCLLTQLRLPGDDQMPSLAARLGTRNEHVVKAVAWLEGRISEEFLLEDCADHVGVTPRQIQRLFRRYLDLTPVQYLTNLRLSHGRMLLSETNMTVMEVAVACGYVSASHFAKGFRRKYGVAPGKYTHFPGHAASRAGA